MMALVGTGVGRGGSGGDRGRDVILVSTRPVSSEGLVSGPGLESRAEIVELATVVGR